MEELVIVSGKGGTGKTSITACFGVLAKKAVIADCDVDASNLHLLLNPDVITIKDFYSGKEAIINPNKCIDCGLCLSYCRFEAIKRNKNNHLEINTWLCEGCGVCVKFCPKQAIDFKEALCGKIMVSQTRVGFLIDARMEAGAENSGKLVTNVRLKAKEIALENGASLVVVDGPPGIGCPAIASITGSSKVLVVTEPTVSGLHDMARVLKLIKHFKIPSFICVNRWDINPEKTYEIEKQAKELGASILGRVSYDEAFSKAQIEGRTMVETSCKTADEIKQIWQQLNL